MNKSQPWIFSRAFDCSFILAPAFLITFLVFIFSKQISELSVIPPWVWLMLIVGVDVSHVYSTIFRTYLNKEELQKRQILYIMTPIFAWVVGCMLYSLGEIVFWRTLAYLAVFHFVRQQYGFMMIYGRKEYNVPNYYKLLDKFAIYLSTIYPLIYWHCNAREFEWFIEGDFFKLHLPYLQEISAIFYIAILCAYIIKEGQIWRRSRTLNVPKHLLLLGTAISWYVGIIIFNNDLAFSAINVVAHGIPYIALIWIYSRNQRYFDGPKYSAKILYLFQARAVPLYLLVLFLLAYLEESIWDFAVWHEHPAVFTFLSGYYTVFHVQTLSWLVPLLVVPQATHYILDAFIWRMHTQNTNWKQILFYQPLAGKA